MSKRLTWHRAANGDMKAGPYTVTSWLGYYWATFELEGYERLEARRKTEPEVLKCCEQHADALMQHGFGWPAESEAHQRTLKELGQQLVTLIDMNAAQQQYVENLEGRIASLHKEGVAQRRTIATLTARKRRGEHGKQSFRRQKHKAGSKAPCYCGHCLTRFDWMQYDHWSWRATAAKTRWRFLKEFAARRIAEIHKLGSLPGDVPSMPGFFYDGAWHAKPADGYKGRATFDVVLVTWTWWVAGFAGYVRAKSYQEARAQAEIYLRNIGVLP